MVHDAVREAVGHLIGSRQIRPDSFADPVYIVLCPWSPGPPGGVSAVAWPIPVRRFAVVP
ncbi:hypothetical protein [Streptomyces exfoliatus]|uniref:hypothetical protein n=1 Tax=Streptomyces exfoliatus TaxID=1905 RepID=UPI0032452D60